MYVPVYSIYILLVVYTYTYYIYIYTYNILLCVYIYMLISDSHSDTVIWNQVPRGPGRNRRRRLASQAPEQIGLLGRNISPNTVDPISYIVFLGAYVSSIVRNTWCLLLGLFFFGIHRRGHLLTKPFSSLTSQENALPAVPDGATGKYCLTKRRYCRWLQTPAPVNRWFTPWQSHDLQCFIGS